MPAGEGNKGAWSTEESLDYLARLLFHYTPTPNAKAVDLPPGRTEYAAQHFLRKIKAQYAKASNTAGSNGNGTASPAPTPKRKRVAKPKGTPKGKKEQTATPVELDDDGVEQDDLEESPEKKPKMDSKEDEKEEELEI